MNIFGLIGECLGLRPATGSSETTWSLIRGIELIKSTVVGLVTNVRDMALLGVNNGGVLMMSEKSGTITNSVKSGSVV